MDEDLQAKVNTFINRYVRKAKVFIQQHQKAIDAKIQGVEYCEYVFIEAGMLIEDAVIDENDTEMYKKYRRRRIG